MLRPFLYEYRINKSMDVAAEIGRNPRSKHQTQPEYGDDARDGTGSPQSRETKFSGAIWDREILISPVQLTTSRIGNWQRYPVDPFYHLDICGDHTYIHTYSSEGQNKKL